MQLNDLNKQDFFSNEISLAVLLRLPHEIADKNLLG